MFFNTFAPDSPTYLNRPDLLPTDLTIKFNNAKRSIPTHPTFVNDTHRELDLGTVTSKSIGFTMVNMSAKFNEEKNYGLVCIWFTVNFHTCPL